MIAFLYAWRMASVENGLTPLLEVFDMAASLAFYRDALGFEVVQSAGMDWAMLRLGSAVLMLNTRYEAHERPDAPDERRTIGHSDVELFIGCADIDAAYGDFIAKRLRVEKPFRTHYGGMQLWVTDPDGFRVCFHSVGE